MTKRSEVERLEAAVLNAVGKRGAYPTQVVDRLNRENPSLVTYVAMRLVDKGTLRFSRRRRLVPNG